LFRRGIGFASVKLPHVVELYVIAIGLVFDVKSFQDEQRTSVLGSLAKPKSAPKNRRSAFFQRSSETQHDVFSGQHLLIGVFEVSALPHPRVIAGSRFS
jgi:hypothetical protein